MRDGVRQKTDLNLLESGQPTPSLGRAFVAEQFNVNDDEKTKQL